MSPDDRSSPDLRFRLNRRRLLGAAGAAAIAPLAGPLARLANAQKRGVRIDPWYLADTTGNGHVGPADLRVIRRAIGARRGTGLEPREGYDARADVLARGFVDELDLDSVRLLLGRSPTPAELPPRPVTVAWHYAWYNRPQRTPHRHTAWFKGGPYSSRSPEVETTFNRLKDDFGVSVDALAWADPRVNRKLERNLKQGYLQAEGLETRRCALLYETFLSLRGVAAGARVDFGHAPRRTRITQHFRQMGRFFARIRDDSAARPFTIQGRPVVFLFGSHAWGLRPGEDMRQHRFIDATMENARNAFRQAYGIEPYIVGEEIPLTPESTFDDGRALRSANFDGIYSYHHMTTPRLITQGGGRLKGRYVERLMGNLVKAYEGSDLVHNRFTGEPLFVIPSLGAGFAKRGSPTLAADRIEYQRFLRDMVDFHQARFMESHYRPVDGRLQPMVVSLGSWNEEFEGHALFPAEFNDAMSPMTRHGFDWLQAVKSVFRWNHYAARDPRIELVPEVDLDDGDSGR